MTAGLKTSLSTHSHWSISARALRVGGISDVPSATCRMMARDS